MNELEEKVAILEELMQGFLKRMTVMEAETPQFLKDFLQQYQETLNDITARIEIANKRYDDQKIQQQIDEVRKLMGTIPKVIHVKNHHHFGAWSKSLMIGLAACFFLTSTSIGTALYLNHRNDQLNSEAFNFWLVRALYPEVSKSIENKLQDDPDAFIKRAEKAMEKQKAVSEAQLKVDEASKQQKEAKEDLEEVKSGD